MITKAWICGTKTGRNTDKFRLASLEPMKSLKVRPPRIKGCPIQLECKVEFLQQFGDHCLTVGLMVEEHVETAEYKPVLHFSGKKFFKLGKLTETT